MDLVRGSGSMLCSGWLSRSRTATPHRYIQINITYKKIYDKLYHSNFMIAIILVKSRDDMYVWLWTILWHLNLWFEYHAKTILNLLSFFNFFLLYKLNCNAFDYDIILASISKFLKFYFKLKVLSNYCFAFIFKIWFYATKNKYKI